MSNREDVGIFYVFDEREYDFSLPNNHKKIKKNNENVLLLSSGVNFKLPKIALEETLFNDFENNIVAIDILEDMTYRFIDGDYGFVTKKEYEYNEKVRLEDGTRMFMIGRYSYKDKSIVLEIYSDFGVMYYPEQQEFMEPIIFTELLKENEIRNALNLEEISIDDRSCEIFYLDYEH